MSFNNLSFALYALLIICVFIAVNVYVNKKFFNWIKLYWNYKRTSWNRISSVFYYLSFILLVISLLDLRGPEERIKTSIPDQKTIIILDSSASMLAEDIKPNRFSKAVQLARHFVKNAPGHQIAVVLFSDVQKRLIPFTDDIDLLDSRLAALDKNNAISGGSNIAQAIKEALGYFQTQKNDSAPAGNILVFTDAEESDGGFSLKLDNEINLAVVGIGTAQGSTIPIRWSDGSFRGYKSKNNENVITKLDENYIKGLGKNVANYQYWIANSYSLPTNEIKDFFRAKFNQKNSQGDVRVRPVLGHLIIIPAIIFFCISIILSRFKTFKALMLTFIFLMGFGSHDLVAQDDQDTNKEKKEIEIPLHIKIDLLKLKNGTLNQLDTLKLAEEFLRFKDPKSAVLLYQDNISDDSQIEAFFNMATALLAEGKTKEAMKIGKVVFESDADDEIKDQLRSNFLLSQENQKGDGKKDKENKEDKEKKDQKKEDQDKDNKDNKENQKDEDKDSKDSKEPSDSKDSKEGDKSDSQQNQSKSKEEKEKENKSDKPKPEPEDLKKPEREESRPQTIEEKEKAIEQQKKMIKTPAMIKQILNDDRELQKKLMDTSTNDKGSSKGKRDW